MHLVGFIIRIYHDARSSECQKKETLSLPGIEPQFLGYLDRSVVSIWIRLACVVSNNKLKRKQRKRLWLGATAVYYLTDRRMTIKLSTCNRSSGRDWNSGLRNHVAEVLRILSPCAVSFTRKATRHVKLLVREWVPSRNGVNKDEDDGEMVFRYWRTLTWQWRTNSNHFGSYTNNTIEWVRFNIVRPVTTQAHLV